MYLYILYRGEIKLLSVINLPLNNNNSNVLSQNNVYQLDVVGHCIVTIHLLTLCPVVVTMRLSKFISVSISSKSVIYLCIAHFSCCIGQSSTRSMNKMFGSHRHRMRSVISHIPLKLLDNVRCVDL